MTEENFAGSQNEFRAIEDIRKLKARYCRMLDAKNRTGWRDTFIDDLVVDVSDGMGREQTVEAALIQGADAFVDGTLGMLASVTSVHQVYSPEINLTSADTAEAIWQMEDRLWVQQPAISPLGFNHVHGWGHYHETYRKQGGEWRIASLRLTRVHVETT